MSEEYTLNQPTSLTCPECGGALAKVDGDAVPRYVCHIGHELTGEAMLEAQAKRVEWLLGGALAILNERRELCRQLMHDGISDTAGLDQTTKEATQRAEALRDLLNGHGEKPGM